jgi:hypothetical protein
MKPTIIELKPTAIAMGNPVLSMMSIRTMHVMAAVN